MEKKRLNFRLNQSGFTLLEVLMAFTLFSLFITAFMLSQGSNITRSSIMLDDLNLHTLCERKLNEAILDPPTFTNATKNDVKTGKFEEEGFTQYTYKIEYIPLELPDLKHVLASGKEDEREDAQAQLTKSILDKMKKNLEKMLWQIRVTVTNTGNNMSYNLSTWITNNKANLDTNFSL